MSEGANQQNYRVLARKYRPSDFDSLIGQGAMVRTLSNAIDTGRLAHAFILTGVRGVGKTTTARIIAKALNCTSVDGPTINPCGTCENCISISQSRHVDVLEMDAASRTGVDDIREIIESVRYAPISARYKIYIIDEVHMLSKSAFNALLKTLEEPPEHVKFIFATTEIRKLPVTVLSRCQRFDLKRVEAETLIDHLAKLVAAENCSAEDGALKLIARAAEGSVRDSLSLLDQAIAHGAGNVAEGQVRDMLGLADRAQVLDLFEQIMKGEIAVALKTLRQQYDSGADPVVVINDLLEVSHWLTRLKVTPDIGTDTLVSEAEKQQGTKMSASLSMPHLTRAWQMLMKGLTEVRVAPSAIAAAEMVLIRLAYASDLPNPADLVTKLKNQNGGSVAGAPGASGPAVGGPTAMTAQNNMGAPTASASASNVVAMRETAVHDGPPHPMPIDFEKMVALFRSEKEGVLATIFMDHVRLVEYRPGAITLNTTRRTPQDFMMRAKQCLKAWTGTDWTLTIDQKAEGAVTLKEQSDTRERKRREETLEDPAVRALLSVFPEAKLLAVRDRRTLENDALSEPVFEVPDDSGISYDDEPSEFDF
jgi:DNA polymerase-3 subunit gamma/tau